MPHTIIDDVIARLSRPLNVADREAFRAAAQDAVSRVPCLGEGAIYRAVASLQRGFRDPPSDRNAHWDIDQELGPSKLRDGPPIKYDDLRRVPRKHARAR